MRDKHLSLRGILSNVHSEFAYFPIHAKKTSAARQDFRAQKEIMTSENRSIYVDGQWCSNENGVMTFPLENQLEVQGQDMVASFDDFPFQEISVRSVRTATVFMCLSGVQSLLSISLGKSLRETP